MYVTLSSICYFYLFRVIKIVNETCVNLQIGVNRFVKEEGL